MNLSGTVVDGVLLVSNSNSCYSLYFKFHFAFPVWIWKDTVVLAVLHLIFVVLHFIISIVHLFIITLCTIITVVITTIAVSILQVLLLSLPFITTRRNGLNQGSGHHHSHDILQNKLQKGCRVIVVFCGLRGDWSLPIRTALGFIVAGPVLGHMLCGCEHASVLDRNWKYSPHTVILANAMVANADYMTWLSGTCKVSNSRYRWKNKTFTPNVRALPVWLEESSE